MKCLIVVANPSDTSFTNALVARFKAGLDSEGHDYETINLFHDDYPNDFSDTSYRRKIVDADAICFAFPWWFEMPPYPLAAFFQRNLVEGFAFRHENGQKIPLLNGKKVQVLITMGQQSPEYNIYCVREGLRYTGLKINNELVALNVGPRLDPTQAQEYLNRAELAGQNILQK